MRRLVTAFIFALALPFGAIAQSPPTAGAMSGTLDGVEVSYVIADGNDVATWWHETDEGVEVSLTAYPSDSPVDDANVLRFTFIGDTANQNPEMLGGAIALQRNDATLSASDDAINFDLESLEVSGDSLLLIGNITVTLSPGEENVSLLAEEGTTLSANIQATILRTDDSGRSSGQ